MFSNLVVKEGDEYNNHYRESLSERIIKNASLNEIAEKLMYEKNKKENKKGEKIMNFAKFIKLYNINKHKGAMNYVG